MNLKTTDLLNEITFRCKEDQYAVSVDLIKKNLIINGQYWIREGKVTDLAPIDLLHTTYKEPAVDILEQLYEVYKYSYPTESESKKKHNYFYALPAEKLDEYDLVNGVDRYLARVVLESAVLLFTVSGYLKWDESWGTWYYKGSDPGFILLRDWVDILLKEVTK